MRYYTMFLKHKKTTTKQTKPKQNNKTKKQNQNQKGGAVNVNKQFRTAIGNFLNHRTNRLIKYTAHIGNLTNIPRINRSLIFYETVCSMV